MKRFSVLRFERALIIRFLFVGLIYISFPPWFFWFAGGKLQLIISPLLLMLLFREKVNTNNLLFFSILYVLGVVLYFILGQHLHVLLVLSLSSAIIVLFKESDVFHISELFKKSLALICLPGLFLWLIHIMSGDLSIARLGALPASIVSELKVQSGYNYILYPFSLRIDSASHQLYFPGIYRFQSMFDEPGFLGTVCALYLASEGQKNFNKYSFVLLLSGIASFSLAFYIIYFTYLLLTGLLNIRYLIYGLFLFLLTIIPVMLYTDLVDIYILSRLEVVGGGISGNNRTTNALDEIFLSWFNTQYFSELMLGVKYDAEGSSSWKLIFIRGGLLAPFILALYYMLISIKFIRYKSINWSFIVFLMVFILSAYQRIPYISVIYLFIFVSAMIHLLPVRLNNKVHNLK